jgi:hypothetical protein
LITWRNQFHMDSQVTFQKSHLCWPILSSRSLLLLVPSSCLPFVLELICIHAFPLPMKLVNLILWKECLEMPREITWSQLNWCAIAMFKLVLGKLLQDMSPTSGWWMTMVLNSSILSEWTY